jgi:hypothetical protein
MAHDFIKLRDVMKHLYAGLPATIKFYTYSESRKTGGKLKKLEGITLSTIEDREGKQHKPNYIPAELSERKPSQYLHGIINVVMKNGELHKLRKIFIKEFNGMEVVL